jgi:predicted Zn-dependent protease
MLTPDKVSDIFSRIRQHSTADEVELIVTGGQSALTRFANNTIHQNMAEENYVLSVRSVFSGRTARATTNRFDEESLRSVVQASEALARVQEPDADLLPLPEPALGGAPPVRRAFFETAGLGPGERAQAVSRMVAVANRYKLTAAGVVASSETVEALVNSRGLSAYHTQTSAEYSITMLAEDSSGWQKANSPDVRVLDPAALAEIAARKALDSAKPTEMPPGKYTVILEPAAVLDLLGFLFWDWGGQAVLDERSFLTGRVGTRLFGENINIYDDAYHPLQSGPPFDGEGVRRRRLQLVENGTVRRLVYARATAEKMRKSDFASTIGLIEPTGHGLPLPNELGELPQNIVVQAREGNSTPSLDQMVASTERGFLVTRLWYIREVDPYEKILTGMTRDGTFYVENGRLRHGVRNFRFNESLLHMLSHVLEMSPPVRASGEESFDMVVPAMKAADFNFTEVTRF